MPQIAFATTMPSESCITMSTIKMQLLRRKTFRKAHSIMGDCVIIWEYYPHSYCSHTSWLYPWGLLPAARLSPCSVIWGNAQKKSLSKKQLIPARHYTSKFRFEHLDFSQGSLIWRSGDWLKSQPTANLVLGLKRRVIALSEKTGLPCRPVKIVLTRRIGVRSVHTGIKLINV